MALNYIQTCGFEGLVNDELGKVCEQNTVVKMGAVDELVNHKRRKRYRQDTDMENCTIDTSLQSKQLRNTSLPPATATVSYK